MKLRVLVALLGLAMVGASCGGGGEDEPVATPTEAPAEAVSPTPDGSVAVGEVSSGKTLRSRDGGLEVRGTGAATLEVTIAQLGSDAPAAPVGWALATAVYDVTGAESGRAVTTLTDPLELRFEVDSALATVVFFDGGEWQMVESERDGEDIVATVDHLSVFAVAEPATVRAVTPAPTPTTTPTAAPDGSATPTPRLATATPAAVDPEVAAAALEDVIKQWRSRAATVTGAGDYGGTPPLELPQPLLDAIAGAEFYGDGYYGVYGGVNGAFVNNLPENQGRSVFTMLVEPKLTFPQSGSQAQRLLADYFPGATGKLFVEVNASPAMYAYQATLGTTVVVLGFVEHEGVPLAFLSAGSGVFFSAATDARD